MIARLYNGELHAVLFEAKQSATNETLIIHQNVDTDEAFATPATVFFGEAPQDETNKFQQLTRFEIVPLEENSPNHRLRALISLTSKNPQLQSPNYLS